MLLQRKINGHVFSHASIEATINASIFPAIQEITYGHECEPGHVFVRGIKSARTRGRYNPKDATIKLYKGDYDHLRGSLGAGFMTKAFDITVNYGEEGEPLITDILRGCRIKDAETTSSQDNADAVMVTVMLDVMEVVENSADAVLGIAAGVVGAALNATVSNLLP